MSSASRVSGIAAAIALIVLPMVALALRWVLPGWFMQTLRAAALVLLLAYALAVVIAITGFLTRRAAFTVARMPWRAVTASWVAAAGVLLCSVFLVDDVNDGPWGSPFTVLLGVRYPSGALTDANHFASSIFGLLTLAGFGWLVVEWVIALVQRRKRSTPISI